MTERWTEDLSDHPLPPKEWLSELPKAEMTESTTVMTRELQTEG
jgi:hypothetical protein